MAGIGPMPGAPMSTMGDANGMPGPSLQMMNSVEDPKSLLPTFIYDFFRKTGRSKLAAAMLSEPDSSGVKVKNKTSPSRQVNGANVPKAPDGKELPEALVPDDLPESSFLEDWFCQFLDMYNATHSQNKAQSNSNLYWMHALAQRKMAMQGNQNLVTAGVQQPGQYQRFMAGAGGNMMATHLQQKLSSNGRPGMMQPGQYPMGMRNMPQQMNQAPMQRGGSGMDANNQGQSPMSGDNAPSPKRARLEVGGQMNRPSSDPNMSQKLQYSQGLHATTQGKMQDLQGMGQMGMQQGSPMGTGDMAVDQFNSFGPPGMARTASGPAQSQQAGGALADYQMQLMLLEQQNKKRLMMARQEQENTVPGARPDGGPGGPQTPLNQNAFNTAMAGSQANRKGQSPNNGDQINRGTPKVGQNSPLPDGMGNNRGSPVPGNFDNNAMQQNMGAQFMGQPGQMGPNGMMGGRPPSSNPNMVNPGQIYGGVTPQQMEAIARNNVRPPNGGAWPGMMPNQGQMPQQGLEQQRNNMPPPQGPVPGSGNAGKPSPPQQNNGNPPTPSQTNKAAPSTKKKKEDNKKKPAKKGANTTGATPNSEAEQPATPTTPMHPQSFSGQGQKPQGAQANQQQQSQQQAPQGPQQSQAQQQSSVPAGQAGPGNDGVQPDHGMNAGAPFGNIADQGGDMTFIGDFQQMDGDQVLDGFDFDSFLIDPESGANWNLGDDAQFASLNGDGLDAGTGGA